MSRNSAGESRVSGLLRERLDFYRKLKKYMYLFFVSRPCLITSLGNFLALMW